MQESMIYIDNISIIMMALILTVGVPVILFSRNYMEGDSRKTTYFCYLVLLILSVIIFSISNHILLIILSLGCANLLLVKLMIHKSSWQAAVNSGKLTFKYLMLGFSMVAIGLIILSSIYNNLYLQNITSNIVQNNILEQCAMLLIIFGILAQSGIFPFHKWLISSLNSPTPVSAIMHAGLVNSSAFLLARLAPLYFQYQNLMDVIFIFGFITAILGTMWKLLQSDIKRMLACSTMGQMGFMIMQCGLGLFSAALAHMCFHGFFKAYLFLSSGESYAERRVDTNYPPTLITFILSLLAGIFGLIAFISMSQLSILNFNSNYVIFLVIIIAGSQLALSVLKNQPFKNFITALIIAGASGVFYGFCIRFFENILDDYDLLKARELNIIHITCSTCLVLSWFMMVMSNFLEKSYKHKFIRKLYVWMLNRSLADKSTITAHKKSYNYN